MRLKVTTETGSFYFIDTEEGRWSKNHRECHGRISALNAGAYFDRREHAFEQKGTWRAVKVPEVGKCMLIAAGLKDWYITTTVLEVTENPEDWPEEGLLKRVETELYGGYDEGN